jgi:hypothetical protein
MPHPSRTLRWVGSQTPTSLNAVVVALRCLCRCLALPLPSQSLLPFWFVILRRRRRTCFAFVVAFAFVFAFAVVVIFFAFAVVCCSCFWLSSFRNAGGPAFWSLLCCCFAFPEGAQGFSPAKSQSPKEQGLQPRAFQYPSPLPTATYNFFR